MFRLRTPFCMHRSGWLLILLCVLIGIRMSGWKLGLPLGALLVASLMLHEAGHIIMASILKVPVREFGLKLGGAYVKRAQATRRRDEILIAVSGPLLSLLTVFPLIFVPLLGIPLAVGNLVIGVVNLLPFPSSDGLRILRHLTGLMPASDAESAMKIVHYPRQMTDEPTAKALVLSVRPRSLRKRAG